MAKVKHRERAKIHGMRVNRTVLMALKRSLFDTLSLLTGVVRIVLTALAFGKSALLRALLL